MAQSDSAPQGDSVAEALWSNKWTRDKLHAVIRDHERLIAEIDDSPPDPRLSWIRDRLERNLRQKRRLLEQSSAT